MGLPPRLTLRSFQRFEETITMLLMSMKDFETILKQLSTLERQFHIIGKGVLQFDFLYCYALDYVYLLVSSFVSTIKSQWNSSDCHQIESSSNELRRGMALLSSLVFNKGESLSEDDNQLRNKFHEMGVNRRLAIEEIVHTERNYLSQMTEFEQLFILPLQQSSIVDKKDFDMMFGSLKIIIGIIKDHFAEMEGALSDPRLAIGSAFLRLCPWLKHYAVYINVFDDSIKTIQSFKKNNPEIVKLFRAAEKKSTCNYDLSSYMILPVQRLGRYELLLKRVLECTSLSHPDHDDLKTALSNVCEINRQINSYKRAEDNRQKIEQISQKFVVQPKPPLYVDGRILVRTSICGFATGKGSHKLTKNFFVALFDDLLLVCKITKADRYEKKVELVLTEHLVMNELKDHELCIMISDGSKGGVSYWFYFESNGQKDLWVRSLREVLSGDSGDAGRTETTNELKRCEEK
jgi:hypothetical protein